MIDRRNLDTLLRSDPAALVQRCKQIIDSPLHSTKDRVYARIRMARGLTLLGQAAEGAKNSNIAYEEAQRLNNAEIMMYACSEQGVQSYFAEDFLAALTWHDAALDLARQDAIDDARYARILVNKANALTRLNSNVEAIDCYNIALEIARSHDDKQLMATLLSNLAILILHVQDEPEREREYLEEALSLFRGLGDRVGQINALTSLAVWHRSHGSLIDSAAMFDDVATLCRRDGIPVPASTLFHTLITHCLRNDVESAKQCLDSLATLAAEQTRWEVEAELAIGRGLFAKLENRLADCIEAYETAYTIYMEHEHHRQAEDVLRQLIPCLEEYDDSTKLCRCYRLLHESLTKTRAIESEHSLSVLAAKHEREIMRQQTEINRLQNIKLARAHDELVRSTFVLDRLIENCAVRLSMPLDVITEILTSSASTELTTEMLEEIRCVFEQLLSDVGDMLLKDSQDVGHASLQTLDGVIAFVRTEVDLRLAKRGSTCRWTLKAEKNSRCSIDAAKYHSMVMRVVDMMHTVFVGSIQLDVTAQQTSDYALEMIVRGTGSAALPLEEVRRVLSQGLNQRVGSMPSSIRSLRMTWLAVQYAIERLGATHFDVKSDTGMLEMCIIVPDSRRIAPFTSAVQSIT